MRPPRSALRSQLCRVLLWTLPTSRSGPSLCQFRRYPATIFDLMAPPFRNEAGHLSRSRLSAFAPRGFGSEPGLPFPIPCSSRVSRSRPYVKGAVSFTPRTMVAGRPMLRQIVIEAETPGDSRTMFHPRIDARLIADGLTAVQAHVLIGEILERVALPNSSNKEHPPTDSLVARCSPAASPGPRGWSGWRSLARRHEAFDEARNEA